LQIFQCREDRKKGNKNKTPINKTPYKRTIDGTPQVLDFDEFEQRFANHHLDSMISDAIHGIIEKGDPTARLPSTYESEQRGRLHYDQFLNGSTIPSTPFSRSQKVRLDCDTEQIAHAIRQHPYTLLLLDEYLEDETSVNKETHFLKRITGKRQEMWLKLWACQIKSHMAELDDAWSESDI
jgi:hypothetical protein